MYRSDPEWYRICSSLRLSQLNIRWEVKEKTWNGGVVRTVILVVVCTDVPDSPIHTSASRWNLFLCSPFYLIGIRHVPVV